MATLLLALWLQGEPMDALLRRFSDDDPSRRDEATKAILEGWTTWKEADLALLQKAGNDPEQELAGRAREALQTIRLRRRLGETLLKRLPDLEAAIRSGPYEQRWGKLVQAAVLWKEGKLEDAHLRTLATLANEGGWFRDSEGRTTIGAPPGVNGPVPPYASLVAPLLKDPDPEERTKAAVLLGTMSAREYAPDIVSLLKAVDKSPRVAALRALASMEAREHLGAIADQLDPTEAYEIKLAAIEALGHLGASDAYAARIIPYLQDGAPDLVRAAIDTLGHAGLRAKAPGVAELLKSDSPTARAAAVEVLGRMGATEFAPAVSGLLRDRELCRGALEALGRMGAREQAGAVVPYLKDAEESVRSEAARALGRMGEAAQAPLLIPLLDEASVDVCWKAVHALGTLVGPGTSDGVVRLLGSDIHLVRGLAANILAQIGAADRADAIRELLDEGQPFVRAEAARALAALGAARHRKAIVPLLEDDFEEVRTDAALALAELARIPPEGNERDLILGRLGEAARNPAAPDQVAARVALALHDKQDRAGQLQALRGAREIGFDFPEAVFLGLARCHEAEASDRLGRPLTLDRAVDSMARVQETLASVGLKLEGEESLRIQLRVAPGLRTTARRLLQELWETKYVVPRGQGVRLLARDEAYDAWESRLQGK